MSGGKGALSGQAIIVGALPHLSQEDAMDFYDRAFKSLPITRVRGFHGVCDGSEESANDVVLFMYDEDYLNPVLKFVCDRKELLMIYKALGDLIRQRFA